MLNSSNNSVVVTSNQRCAISTAIIALWNRFDNNNECIYLSPCMQELGIGLNTSVSNNATIPQLSNFEKINPKLNVQEMNEFYIQRLIMHELSDMLSFSDIKQRLGSKWKPG
eukprot:414968_1